MEFVGDAVSQPSSSAGLKAKAHREAQQAKALTRNRLKLSKHQKAKAGEKVKRQKTKAKNTMKKMKRQVKSFGGDVKPKKK